MRGSYAEDTYPSSKVDVTDEDESKEIIVHKTLTENLSKDVNEYNSPRKIKMHLRSTIRNIIIFMSTKMK